MNSYLYIGYPSPISKELYNSLFTNKQIFLDHGYQVIELPSEIEEYSSKSHQAPFDLKSISDLENIVSDLQDMRINQLIIIADNFYQCTIDQIKKIAGILKKYETQIIIDLFPQHVLLQNLWTDIVTFGYETNAFDDWIKEHIYNNQNHNEGTNWPEYLDYMTILSKWQSVFGFENIHIRIYDNLTYASNILQDFCSTLEPETQTWIPILNNTIINPSIKSIEVIRYFARKLNEEGVLEGKAYRDFIAMLRVNSHLQGWNEKSPQLISKEFYQILCSQFEESNRSVATSFLDRNQLFEEPTNLDSISTFNVKKLNVEETLQLFGDPLTELLFKVSQITPVSGRILNRISRLDFIASSIEKYPRFIERLKALYRWVIRI